MSSIYLLKLNLHNLIIQDNQILQLNNQISQLQLDLSAYEGKYGRKTLIPTNIYLNKNIDISNIYFKYVEKFGFPQDGIFDPNLLEQL